MSEELHLPRIFRYATRSSQFRSSNILCITVMAFYSNYLPTAVNLFTLAIFPATRNHSPLTAQGVCMLPA